MQVARQPAMEALPLVMEPESRFYADPVIVLDFQSLYPSIVIAYNLCFSTCIGRPQNAAADASDDTCAGPQLGCSTLNLPAGTLQGSLAPDRYRFCWTLLTSASLLLSDSEVLHTCCLLQVVTCNAALSRVPSQYVAVAC